MVSNCANPACAVPLTYLRDGRLFQFEIRPQPSTSPEASTAINRRSATAKLPGKVSHFWLCGECASKLTLVFDQFKAVVLKPTIAA
jgi:hypothetical protein